MSRIARRSNLATGALIAAAVLLGSSHGASGGEAGVSGFWAAPEGVGNSAETGAGDGSRAPPQYQQKMFYALGRVVGLPRLGIVVDRRDGRPRIDGLSLRANRRMRFTASGDWDQDNDSVSGFLRVHLEF